MKKLLTILLILFAFIVNAQDLSPLPSITGTVKKLIAPNTPVFYYNTLDSAMWVFKGETGWYRFASLRDFRNYWSKTEITTSDTTRWGLGGTSSIKAANGLHLSSDTVKLGGNLIEDTNIALNDKTIIFSDSTKYSNGRYFGIEPSNVFISIIDSIPNTNSIVDISKDKIENVNNSDSTQTMMRLTNDDALLWWHYYDNDNIINYNSNVSLYNNRVALLSEKGSHQTEIVQTSDSISNKFRKDFNTIEYSGTIQDSTGIKYHRINSEYFQDSTLIPKYMLDEGIISVENNQIFSLDVSGTNTKTITLTKQGGGTLTDTFTDLDNQTLSVSTSGTTRNITISGGNYIGINVADNDNDPLNEIQAPTRVGDNIGLTQTNTTISIADKLSTTLNSGNIFVGNASNIATGVTASGDASITNAGLVAVNKTRLNVRNETGTTITNTKVVYVDGFNNLPLIKLADNTDLLKHDVIGVTIASITDQANGIVATSGQFDAETNTWNVKDILYLSTSGNLVTTPPTSGAVIRIGEVTVKENYPTGKILLAVRFEENIVAGGATENIILRTGDNAGTNKVSVRNYANTEVANINSLGQITASQTTTTGDTYLLSTTSGLINKQLKSSLEPALIKGNLTAGSNKVTIGGTGTGAVIGSGASVDVNEENLTLSNIGGSVTDSQVPNTITLDNITQITNRSSSDITEGSKLFYTDARARAAISETVTGLDYNNTTGVISQTTGYGIPTTTQIGQIHVSGSDNQTISTTGAVGNITLSGSGGTLNLNVNDADASITNEGQLSTVGTANNATIQSNTSGSNVLNIRGAGINVVSASGNAITVTATEVDGSITNEGQLTVAAGTSTSSIINSNTSGQTGVTVQVDGTNLGISETGNVVTLSNLKPDTYAAVTKGNLTESITGLQFDNTRQVIGGTADLSVTSGYLIPSTASATAWDNKQPQLNGTGFVKASGTTISYDNSTYEPAFSKNTAFNKNFGTTAGTVLEGRPFGTAAASNAGDFIQNGTAQQANSNFNISGTGIARVLAVNNSKAFFGFVNDIVGVDASTGAYGVGDSHIATDGTALRFSTLGNNPMYFTTNGWNNKRLTIQATGEAEFSSTIQATTAKLTNLTDGYIPYHISDASGLGNSPIYTDGTNVGIGYSTGSEINNNKLAVNGSILSKTLISALATGSGNFGAPFYDEALYGQDPLYKSSISFGNEWLGSSGTYIKFSVNSRSGTNTPLKVLEINPLGELNIPKLAGSGTRMTIVSSDGTLGSSAIPTGLTLGTTHGTAAYGDHNHAGVYDNYGNWLLSENFGTTNNINSGSLVDFYNGDGITVALSSIVGGVRLTPNLYLAGLTTIVNPTTSYYIPVTGGSSNTKITVTTLESILGTTAGTASRLVMRDGSADAYAHNFILSSDRRLKKNIIDLPNTSWTDKIEFKQFQFKDDPKEKIRFGVIAQDIEQIAPELVSTDENGMKAVSYIDMLIAKISEMDKKINALTQKVEDLEFINEGQKELLNMKKVKRHAK